MPGVFVDDSSKFLGVFALVFAGVGIFVAVAFTTYTFILSVVGAFWACVGLGMLYAVVKATCTIDETTGQLRVATVRAYCFKGQETSYPLDSVLGAELQMQSGRRRMLYRVAIHTTHSGVIAWSTGWSNMGVDTKTNFVQQFNQYLSSVRGGAPIVIPAAGVPGGGVTIVMPHGGSLAVAPHQQQQQQQQQQRQPLLGQPQAQQQQVYVTYNGIQPLPLSSQPQQPQPQYHVVMPQQNAQPPSSYNPYAVQPQASAPPPPYSAVSQQHGTGVY